MVTETEVRVAKLHWDHAREELSRYRQSNYWTASGIKQREDECMYLYDKYKELKRGYDHERVLQSNGY